MRYANGCTELPPPVSFPYIDVSISSSVSPCSLVCNVFWRVAFSKPFGNPLEGDGDETGAGADVARATGDAPGGGREDKLAAGEVEDVAGGGASEAAAGAADAASVELGDDNCSRSKTGDAADGDDASPPKRFSRFSRARSLSACDLP
jgi:hypothetical protein